MSEILKVNQDRLKWVRNSLKYTQQDVGKKLRVTSENVKKWEDTGEIPYDKLEKLSELYEMNTLFFFDNDEPPSINEIPDYRTKNNKQTEKTPEILKEIKRAKTKRIIALNLQEELQTIKPFEYKSDDKKECIEIIQKSLNINLKRKYTFNEWLKEFESLNILIFQFYNIPVDVVRGYALYYKNLPIIGINNSDNEKAKTFTLFHEYAHLILRKSGISDYSLNNVEEICNSIAAEVLLPEKQINKIINKNKMKYPVKLKVKLLKDHFNISKTAITYRLLNLNKISELEAQTYLNELKTSYTKDTSKKRKYKKIKNTDKKYKDASTKVINKYGLLYIDTLLQAKDEDLIDDIELIQELNTNQETMPYIIKKVSEVNMK